MANELSGLDRENLLRFAETKASPISRWKVGFFMLTFSGAIIICCLGVCGQLTALFAAKNLEAQVHNLDMIASGTFMLFATLLYLVAKESLNNQRRLDSIVELLKRDQGE